MHCKTVPNILQVGYELYPLDVTCLRYCYRVSIRRGWLMSEAKVLVFVLILVSGGRSSSSSPSFTTGGPHALMEDDRYKGYFILNGWLLFLKAWDYSIVTAYRTFYILIIIRHINFPGTVQLRLHFKIAQFAEVKEIMQLLRRVQVCRPACDT